MTETTRPDAQADTAGGGALDLFQQACNVADWANAAGTPLENPQALYEAAAKLRDAIGRQKVDSAAAPVAPIDMILHCPSCGTQHIDAPDTEHPLGYSIAVHGGDWPDRWTNPPHRSHLCHGCGHIWRPADVPTRGVAAIKTRGKSDSGLREAVHGLREAGEPVAFLKEWMDPGLGPCSRVDQHRQLEAWMPPSTRVTPLTRLYAALRPLQEARELTELRAQVADLQKELARHASPTEFTDAMHCAAMRAAFDAAGSERWPELVYRAILAAANEPEPPVSMVRVTRGIALYAARFDEDQQSDGWGGLPLLAAEDEVASVGAQK